MSENTITKNEILSELSKSPHGNYKEYILVCTRAAMQEPDFLAHLISWNRDNGQIRDSKVALPVVSLSVPTFALGLTREIRENSLAHLALLDPRNFVKALRFAKEVKLPNLGHQIRNLVERYLRYREADWDRRFIPTVTRYRKDLKELYALYHISRPEKVGIALFNGERGQAKVKPAKGTVLEGIARLKDMGVTEAAAFITSQRIPYLTAKGVLGKRVSEPDILRALIDRMSPTELVTSIKMIEKAGLANLPAVRGAVETAMNRAASSGANLLKTTQAVEAIEDESLKEKLKGLQERQIQSARTVEGDWLVLGDKSGSMAACIEGARQLAATLAKLVTGKVYLVFFDSSPQFIDVTGMTYDQIINRTVGVTARGGTSIGCGLQYLIDRKIAVQGIAVVSDAQENVAPYFAERYVRYAQLMGVEPAVYLYRVGNRDGTSKDLADSMKQVGVGLEEFKLSSTGDYYSIPAFAKTMTVNRYGLIDAVLNTPLITLEMVFDGTFTKTKKPRSYAPHGADGRKEKQHA